MNSNSKVTQPSTVPRTPNCAIHSLTHCFNSIKPQFLSHAACFYLVLIAESTTKQRFIAIDTSTKRQSRAGVMENNWEEWKIVVGNQHELIIGWNDYRLLKGKWNREEISTQRRC